MLYEKFWPLEAFVVSIMCGALALAEDAPPPEAGKEKPAVEEGEAPPAAEGEGGSPLDTEKGRGPLPEGWQPYLELLENKWVEPEAPGDSGAIQLKFNLKNQVPKGTKISFTLEYLGLEKDTTDYILKDENRRNLTLTWKPKEKLATGEYFLRSRIYLKQQTAEVQKSLKGKEKDFPPDFEPWAFYYMTPEQAVKVGGERDEAEEAKALCDSYTALMTELVTNMNEFVGKMGEVKNGTDLVNGGVLDVEKFTDFVVKWRKKQGETQKKILVDFPEKEPNLVQRSQTAYANLLELGRMVSKRAVVDQKEITDQYKVPVINPASHQHFDRSYRYKVTPAQLQRRLETISALVCPQEEEPKEEEKAESGEAPKAQEGKPPGEEEKAPTTETPKKKATKKKASSK